MLTEIVEGSALANLALSGFEDGLLKWEEAINMYDRMAQATPIDDGIKMAVLLKRAPKEIKVHIQVNIASITTYAQMRATIEMHTF